MIICPWIVRDRCKLKIIPEPSLLLRLIKSSPQPFIKSENRSAGFKHYSSEIWIQILLSKLWKICKCLFSQNCTRSVAYYLLVIHFKKSITENQAEEILTVCALFIVCTRFTTLPSFYIKKGLVFSQSEANKFFRYNIIHLAKKLDLIVY